MAWLYKRGKRWWIGWREGGVQKLQPTGETDRGKAEAHLRKYELIRTANAAGVLTAQMVASVSGSGEPPSVHDYVNAWLKEARANTKAVTMVKYDQVATEFLGSIGKTLLMRDVRAEHVKRFLHEKREHAAASTVASFRRILGAVFRQAQNEGVINGNPVALVKMKSTTGKTRKRPFTMEEITSLYSRASEFWRYMLVAGFYTGQSLGDLVTLRRRNVDMSQNQIALNRRKTGTRVMIPMAPALRDWCAKHMPKREDDFFWPAEARRYETTGASSFSQEFYELMVGCGMVPPRGKKSESKGVGRDNKRELSGLGFHNLRHTFVTKLKESGAVDSIARELAGHGSNAMSAHYTHLPPGTLADAIAKLPQLK